MNHPYMPERRREPKDGGDRQWEPHPQSLPEVCDLCRKPLRREWLEVEAAGIVSRFTGRRYCSDRCLGRDAQGLPIENDQAVAAIQSRLTRAQEDYREARRRVESLQDHLDQVRRQWTDLNKIFPGLKEGGVGPAPAGGTIRQHVKQMNQTLAKPAGT